MNHTARYLTACLIFTLYACSQSTQQWSRELPYEPARTPETGDILHTATGHFVSQQQLFSSINHFPFVYVGELHDNPASHRLELEILSAMQQRHPGRISLGMEMFNIDQQIALEQWVAGELSVKAFLRESRWFDNWGMDFELYRELLEYCRDHGIPVIGLNVNKTLARKVSMTPLDALDEASSAQLPEMDMNDPYQQLMIEKIFGAHGAGVTMLESFSRGQTLWDEAMAATLVDYMHEREDHHMLVVAGGWHVNYGFGIPRRVHRRLPLPYVLVGGHNLEIPEQKRSQLMDVELPAFPMPPVDYLVYQKYEVFSPRGVTLGVEIDDSDDQPGVLVVNIVPGSVAELAGIHRGDTLLRIDGVSLNENFDLIFEVRTRRPGDGALIELKRGSETVALEVVFADPQD